jgi:hypothetical protein
MSSDVTLGEVFRGRSDLAMLAEGPQAESKRKGIVRMIGSLGKRGDFIDRYLQKVSILRRIEDILVPKSELLIDSRVFSFPKSNTLQENSLGTSKGISPWMVISGIDCHGQNLC